MKILLYATLMLLATSLNVQAEVEVKDLSTQAQKSEAEQPQTFAWFWQKKPEPKAQTEGKTKTEQKQAQGSAPVPKDVGTPHIALLLPLSGQYQIAAQAIREGFIGAYYLDAQSLGTQTEVRIYDTVADKEVTRAYQNAKDDGANIIVGPLTKPGLERLLDDKVVDNRTIVIALNTLEGRNSLPRYLYPFSLGPEDEAYRVAEQAWYDGHQRAAALIEKDTFGRRAGASFKKRFEQLGGTVVDMVYFDTDRPLEDPVHYLLKVEETKNAGETTFVRRRQDLDFVFLAANPQQGRQIPPLMRFYYAQNVPIYAMGSIYSGTPNPGLDNDLNGIVFCDSPWIVDPNSRNSSLNAISTQLLTQSAAQERLFAFGVDAFKVAKNIRQLSANPEFNVSGTTGTLSMDNSGFIVRVPKCARFSLGAPRVL